MGHEILPPNKPAWRQEFNACANCERLEAKLAATEADCEFANAKMTEYADRVNALETKLETEKDHSKFLGELLQALYGDGWETLTIHEAKKHKAKLAALVKQAIEAKEELEYDISNGQVALDLLKSAVAAAKVTP